MSAVERAAALARHAHNGQLDHAGSDYFAAHVNDVAERMPWYDEQAQTVAYLHDVVEDTAWSLEDLSRDGFSATVVFAVDCITHRPHEPRADYYARVKANPLALRVKLADIASNTEPDRMALLDDETRARLTEKYRKALEALT